jgi:uncharacterized protein with NAD-binding domain and iron-sulfur cluster
MSEGERQTDGITRRRLLRDAGVAAAGATVIGTYGAGSAFARPSGRRKTIAVFGGGIAGLTSAHELAERGFDVTVYERRAWGGKARSTEVPRSGKGGRKPLPGEHGFRFEFGFYRNLPDTMRRIPFGSNANGVWDNVVDGPDWLFARDGARPDFLVPTGPSDPTSLSPERIVGTLTTFLANSDLPADATAYFANRLVVFFSSCDRRRREQWEYTPWTDFMAVARYPDDYRKIVGQLPRFVQASNAPRTSTDWIGQAIEGALYSLMGREDGPFLRLLNGPTNETWIEPWLAHLRRLSVHLRLGRSVKSLEIHHGRIGGAQVSGPNGRHRVEADWYLCALPVERARRLWNRPILAADPRLRRMRRLKTAWMNGIKFFLAKNTPIARGVVLYLDAPWAVTSVNQAQFWASDFASTYGDGRAHDSLSVIVSNWSAPGVIYGKPARECTPKQVVHEVWEQLKRAVNEPGEPPKLTDDLLLSWDIDPGMRVHDHRLVSGDPLTVPTVGSRPDRPDVTTAIPNLLLAGDYLLTDWLVGTMEAANETGKRAANALLDRAGSSENPSEVVPHSRPPEWEPFKRIDEDRYRRGQPNLFDTEMSSARLNELLSADQRLLSSVG